MESLEDRTAPAHLELVSATGGHRSHINGHYSETVFLPGGDPEDLAAASAQADETIEYDLDSYYPAAGQAALGTREEHTYGPFGDFGGLISSARVTEQSSIGVVDLSASAVSYHSALGSNFSRSATASGSFQANGTVRVVADAGESNGAPVTVKLDIEAITDGGGSVEYTVGGVSGSGSASNVSRSFTANIGDLVGFQVLGTSSVFSSNANVSSSSDVSIAINMSVDDPPPPSITVTAVVDGSGSPTDKDFGRFLRKVKMPDQVFTASGATTDIAQFRFKVDDLTPVTVNKTAAGNASYKYDPSDLSADSHSLSVTALDAAGDQVGNPVSYDFEIVDSIGSATITAKTVGSAETPVDQLRLIQDVPLNLTYTVNVPDLPLADYYKDKLAVAFARKPTGAFVSHQNVSLPGKTGSFTLGSSALPDLLPGTDADYSVFITARPGAGDINIPFTAKENLVVAKLPKWMGKAVKKEFVPASAVPANTFDTPDAAYAIRISAGNFSLPLPATSGTPFGMFDGLKSGVDFGVNLVVYAKLSKSGGSVVVRADDAYVNAKLLDETLIDKSAHVGGNLFNLKSVLSDPVLMTAPSSFVIETKENVNLLGLAGIGNPAFDFGFGQGNAAGKGKWEVSIPVYKSVLLDVDGTLSLKGKFHAELTKLALGGSIGLKFEGGYPVIDKATTKASLDVQADAKLALQAGLTVDVTLLKLLTVEAVGVDLLGNAYFHLDSHLAGAYAGNKFVLDKQNSTAALGVAFDLSYNLRTVADQIGDAKPDAPPRELARDSARFALFGLQLPPEDLSTPGGHTKQGTNINIGEAGDIAAFAPAFDTPPGTVDSNVRLRGRVDNSLTNVRVTYAVRSNRETPSAGRHLFAVVLIAPDGTEQTVSNLDLSNESYAIATNDLGFAAAPKTLDVVVPEGLMEPGVPYSLEFRLHTDPQTDGEEVRLGLSNLELTKDKAELGVTVNGGNLTDGGLDFGPDTGGMTQGVVTVRNDGGGTIKVSAVSLVGKGFEFPVALPKTFALYAGESYDIPVRLLSAAAAASAKLKIVTNAPENPIREIPLRYAKDALSQQVSFAVERSFGTEKTAGQLKVVLARPAQGKITVDYAVTGGTAVAGTDFKAFGGTLTFTAGQTVKYITVPVLNNTLNQPLRSLLVSLSNPTAGVALGAVPTATYSIRDDDTRVSFAAAATEATEPAARTAMTIPVFLSAASPFAVTVSYKVTSGTATSGKDYILAAGKLTFAAGQTRKDITLTLLPDLLPEGDETIQITLSSPVGGQLGPLSVLTLTLHDHV